MSMHNEFDRILDYVRVHAPMASDAVIKQSLYETMVEFFRFTSAWTAAASFSTIVNVQTYEIQLPEPGQPIRLIGVFDQNNVGWRAAMPLGIVIIPTNPITVSPVEARLGTIQLVDTPTQAQTLFACFIMNVTLPADGNDLPEVPDWSLQLFSSAFINGTLGALLTQPKKPYTDAAAGQYHLRQFINRKCEARTSAMRMNTHGSQSWTFPQQWRSYGQKGGVSVGNSSHFY
jgi:hypothetical protein